MWAFYAALGSGPISVVAPLAGVLNAAVPVAVGIALGERPGHAASVGVVLAIVAVLLVSREATVGGASADPYRFTPKVAWLTILAGSRVRAGPGVPAPGAARMQALAAGVRPPVGHRGDHCARGREGQTCGCRAASR